MPAATHVHKSMLLRGVVEPRRVLDNSDLAILKSKARTSGRDFGGAPLYDNTRQHLQDRNGNGYSRGGRISYAADRPPPPPPGLGQAGTINRDNPFGAALLDPRYGPPGGMPPPPAQQYGNGNGYRGPSNAGPNGYGYGNAPPRDQGYGYGNGGGGGRGYQGQQPAGGGYGQNDQYYDGDYGGARGGGYQNGGRSVSDGYSQGQAQGYGSRGGGDRDGYRGGHDARNNGRR